MKLRLPFVSHKKHQAELHKARHERDYLLGQLQQVSAANIKLEVENEELKNGANEALIEQLTATYVPR